MTLSARPLHFAAALAMAVAMFASCHDEGTEQLKSTRAGNGRTVVFIASGIGSKTAFTEGTDGVYPAIWTANDAYVKLALGFSDITEAPVEASEDFRTASFAADFDFSAVSAPYTFYAVSPASAARALSASRKAWSVSIPSEQTPLDASVDEAAMIIAAGSRSYESAPDKVDFHFTHLTAYGRMSFTNLDLGDAAVSKVEITATTPIAGDWYWEPGEGHALTDNGASSTITLYTSKTSDIWFACAPVDMSGHIALFTVYTDKGAFVKEVEFPSGRKFNSGRIAVFNVDMSGIAPAEAGSGDFVLVRDAGTLAEGDHIIIANNTGTYALGAAAGKISAPYRERAAIKVSSGTITDEGTSTVLTLVKGVSDGTWALQTEDGKYLSTLSSGNFLAAKDDIGNNSSWTISVTSSGDATICALAGNSKYIRENSTNPRFSAYGENSSLKAPLAVYCQRTGGVAEADDPLTDNEEYGIYQGTDTRVYVHGSDQYIRQYSDSGELTFVIVRPGSNEQIAISGYRNSLIKGDSAIITVNWRVGTKKVLSGATYNVTVVKEDGPRVWLGNGTGRGFIIKK